jgi:hypothetical protein
VTRLTVVWSPGESRRRVELLLKLSAATGPAAAKATAVKSGEEEESHHSRTANRSVSAAEV